MPTPSALRTRWFYGTLFIVGIATFLVHESAHWLAGAALGHDMVATLNSVRSTGPVSVRDQMLITAAGPIITIGQALIGFWLVARSRSPLGFALLYSACFMRVLAAGISVVQPNDEAKISLVLGLGPWAVPLIVVVGLMGLVVTASRRLRLTARDHLLCYVVASVATTLIVGVDMML